MENLRITMPTESEDLKGSMRELDINGKLTAPLKRRNSAQRYAWEMKLIDGKIFTVKLTEDRSEVEITRIA